MQFLTSDELKEGLRLVDPIVYNLTKNHFVVGFSVSLHQLFYVVYSD